MAFASTPQEFKSLVDFFIANPDQRLNYINNGYNMVMREHTYFNRIAEIFHHLQLFKQSQDVIAIFNKMIRG